MADEHNFFALISRMKYIDRWCLMRSSRPENLCEHPLETPNIAHALVLLAVLTCAILACSLYMLGGRRHKVLSGEAY